MNRTNDIRTAVIAFGFIMLAAGCADNSTKHSESEAQTDLIKKETQWTQDQKDVKATVEQFLVVAGNYDLEAMDEMILDSASIGICVLRDSAWKNYTISVEHYFERSKKNELQPYYEPVREWDILINKGQLAFVNADAIFHKYGVPRTNNVDYFNLIKIDGQWKFVSISFTNTALPENEKIFDLETFARSYAQVWSGVRPEFVAMFYREDGVLQVNDGEPAKGRAAIADLAKGFMTRFPDMQVRFDSLTHGTNEIEFHWTLTGTDADPKGKGHKVHVSGSEIWTLSEDNLISVSKGNFPTAEYERQLEFGITN